MRGCVCSLDGGKTLFEVYEDGTIIGDVSVFVHFDDQGRTVVDTLDGSRRSAVIDWDLQDRLMAAKTTAERFTLLRAYYPADIDDDYCFMLAEAATKAVEGNAAAAEDRQKAAAAILAN